MGTSSYPVPGSEQGEVEADQFAQGSAHSSFTSPHSQGDSAVFLDTLFPSLSILMGRNFSLLLTQISHMQTRVCGLSSFPLGAPIPL